MEFRLFGGVDVDREGRPVDAGHQRQRCVLAVLLLEAGRPVSADALIERVWGESAPQRARGALHNYVSGLRRALAPEVRIDRQPGGYCLVTDPLVVDVHRFRALVAQARAGGAADGLLDEALALWRGRPFGSLDTPWLNDAREALQRERHAAELDRNDRALARGRHAELLESLAAATAEHQFDERLAGQFMLALSRSGRPADALRHYETMRRRLADELGTDPGPALRALHLELLTTGAPVPVPVPGVRELDELPVPVSPAVPAPVPFVPAPRRSRRVAAVVALAVAAVTTGVTAWAWHPESTQAVPAPPGLAPLTGDIPDETIVAIVDRRSATSTTEAYVVDVENWSVSEGGRTHLWHWRYDGDFRNQLWRVRTAAGGGRHFVNMFSGLCLAGARSALEVVQSTCSAEPEQRWTIRPDGLLSNGDGTQCLKVRDDLLLEDTSLQMAACQQRWSEQWYLVRRP